MTNLSSYYQSGRMITSLLKYKEGKSYSPIIERSQYEGLNRICPPVKIISPIKFRNKSWKQSQQYLNKYTRDERNLMLEYGYEPMLLKIKKPDKVVAISDFFPMHFGS